MALCEEVRDVLLTVKKLDRENNESFANKKLQNRFSIASKNILDDIIDIDKVDFKNDETWLHDCFEQNSYIKDLRGWLSQEKSSLKDLSFHKERLALVREMTNLNTKKVVDSRTFIRPKKHSRSNLEVLNDKYFDFDTNSSILGNIVNEAESSSSTLKLSDSCNLTCNNSISSLQIKKDADSITTLSFDLSQPTRNNMFERITTTTSSLDCLQNMSPPSLVNSMSSSTFMNLMESSIIKNDPVLREIRDADYSESMLQDYNLPLFQSLTDSCCSINSYGSESFNKQEALEAKLDKIYKKTVSNDNHNPLSVTYTETDFDNTFVVEDNRQNSLDTTYTSCYTSVLDNTYSKDSYNSNDNDDDYNINSDIEINKMQSMAIKRSAVKLNVEFDASPQTGKDIKIYANKLNMDESNNFLKDFNEFNEVVSHKANPMDGLKKLCNTNGIPDKVREPNKMFDMAEIDAIVLKQEQSLQMTGLDQADRLSDYDESSTDDYCTVRSSISSFSSPLGSETHVNRKDQRSKLKAIGESTKISYSNPATANCSLRGSTTNLQKMSSSLRGSYTKLKPVVLNMQSNTRTITKQNHNTQTNNGPKIAEVSPIIRDSNIRSFGIKNCGSKQQLKASGLPRPVSAIPRPTSSRLLTTSSRSNSRLSRPTSKLRLNCDF